MPVHIINKFLCGNIFFFIKYSIMGMQNQGKEVFGKITTLI